MELKPGTIFVHFDENGRVAHVLRGAPKPEGFVEYRLVDTMVNPYQGLLDAVRAWVEDGSIPVAYGQLDDIEKAYLRLKP